MAKGFGNHQRGIITKVNGYKIGSKAKEYLNIKIVFMKASSNISSKMASGSKNLSMVISTLGSIQVESLMEKENTLGKMVLITKVTSIQV